MRQVLSFLVFISVVIALYFGMNFYVLFRLSGFLGIKRRLVFWIVVGVLSLSLVGAVAMEHVWGNLFSWVFYVLSVNWLGVLWMLFFVLMFYEVFRLFGRINERTAGISILVIVGVCTIYSVINAQRIHVKKVAIAGKSNIDIVHISDVHLGSVGKGWLGRIVEEINRIDADVVVITGDLFDNTNVRTRAAVGLVDQIAAPVFFVTGNHEEYAGESKVFEILKNTKVRVLRDESVEFDDIIIAGISDNNSKVHLANVIKGLSTENDKFSLLLCHRPVVFEAAAENGYDLVLSGHTHGGQILGFNFAVRVFYKYISGLYTMGESRMYVSTGAGIWGPMMRLGTQNEVVLLQVRKS